MLFGSYSSESICVRVGQGVGSPECFGASSGQGFDQHAYDSVCLYAYARLASQPGGASVHLYVYVLLASYLVRAFCLKLPRLFR